MPSISAFHPPLRFVKSRAICAYTVKRHHRDNDKENNTNQKKPRKQPHSTPKESAKKRRKLGDDAETQSHSLKTVILSQFNEIDKHYQLSTIKKVETEEAFHTFTSSFDPVVMSIVNAYIKGQEFKCDWGYILSQQRNLTDLFVSKFQNMDEETFARETNQTSNVVSFEDYKQIMTDVTAFMRRMCDDWQRDTSQCETMVCKMVSSEEFTKHESAIKSYYSSWIEALCNDDAEDALQRKYDQRRRFADAMLCQILLTRDMKENG